MVWEVLGWVWAELGTYAMGTTFVWATLLAVVGERVPQTGAVAMSIVGGVGMLAAGLVGGPGLGYMKDRFAGEELKKALPNGGKVMVFVGKADAQNAKERFDGLKKALGGSKIVLLDLRTDDGDRARAQQNGADALVK